MTTYQVSKSGTNITIVNTTTGQTVLSGTDISSLLTSLHDSYIAASGDTISFLSATYSPTSQVRITKSVNLIKSGTGSVTFNWNVVGDFLFTCQGSELTTQQITANVAPNSNTMSVTSTASVNVGELALIYDNTIFNPDFDADWKTGEIHEISNINTTTNTITVTDPTINQFQTSQSAAIRFIRPISVEINGITITGNSSNSTADYRAIQFYLTKNCSVKNCTLSNNGRTGIEVVYSYNTTIDYNGIAHNRMAGFGYGIDLSDAVAHTTISNNTISDSRCCFSQGGSGVVGQVRDTIISNNTFDDTTGITTVIDSHAISESMYIYNNIIYSPSDQWAVGSGSKITKTIGNTIIGGRGTMSYGPTIKYFEVSGNTFQDAYQAFYANNYNQYQLVVKDNILSGNVGAIARFWNTNPFNISGNTFNTTLTTTGEWGINANDSTNGIIQNNHITNPYVSGIDLKNTTNTIISTNIVNLWGPGYYGINLDTGSDNNTVTNNTLCDSSSITNGIQDLGTNNIIQNNTFLTSNCTTSTCPTLGFTLNIN